VFFAEVANSAHFLRTLFLCIPVVMSLLGIRFLQVVQ
jgi:hypothetical protein